ncbi:MAG: hypothetical protein II760_04625 [Lachnospiraceae bacterium]|jgi:UPF0755 protein|nr:hypothetical protein [Lachnospiraceae bacterium]
MTKKKTLFLSLSVLDVVFKIAMWVIIIYFVIKGATRCYNLGYRVFTEEPIASEGYGKEVTVEIPMDFSAKELGELFESKGLSRDSLLFAIQYYASEYREGVRGGTYTFSTEQTAEEMFAQIAAETEAKELEEAEKEEAILQDAEAVTAEDAAVETTEPAEGEGAAETVNP